MHNDKPQKYNSIAFYWIDNLVGTGGRFAFNVIISATGGLLFSFGVWPSVYVLVIFGVISPLLFTFCLYSLVRIQGEDSESPFPGFFRSQASSAVVMFFDMAIIVAIAMLIQLNIIDYLLVRLLQTVIFPVMMLFMLRILLLNTINEDED
ncbi:MAG: hypothetical protein RBT74_08520 [Tenuifilaceae bacterium]|jgi:hypothetical protein|nr:hypothetical protein [Tenuifilaceae bacterium]